MSSADWLRWSREAPDADAVVWDGGAWSWRDLALAVDEWAAYLERTGLRPGDTVALEAEIGPGFLLGLLAFWRMGAVASPVFPGLTASERDRQDRLLRPQWSFAWHESATPSGHVGEPALRPLRPREHALHCGETLDDGRTGAVLLTTSGSTGEPRGVLLSHEALEASARATGERLGLAPHHRWGLLLSPAHAGGLSTVVRGLVLGGGLRFWSKRHRYGAAAASVLRGEVSHLSVVPALAQTLLDEGLTRPPPSFRCLLVGGAATGERLRTMAGEAGLPLALTWGMTETGGQVATAPPEDVAAGAEGVGLPLSGMEVAVGEEGRLSVRGSFLASGVVEGPGSDLAPVPTDGDGWYATQDVGQEGRDGRLQILGRRDEIIVSGGTNVHPLEVEDVLTRHEGVSGAGVVGLPDERWGEVVVAAVVPQGEPPPSEGVLKDWCRKHLTRSRCPTHIVFLPKLPLTRSGKVARRRLAALLSRPGTTVHAAASPTSNHER